VVRIVGIDIASEPASRDGESGALDGLLHEERPRGRAGEGSGGASARGAADQGGDRHYGCGWWFEGAERRVVVQIVGWLLALCDVACSIGLSWA
jgi:hypothetical protein